MSLTIDLPELNVSITTSPVQATAGDPFNITCTVTYTERLIVVPTMSWEYTNDANIQETKISSLTKPSVSLSLVLDSAVYDQNGIYTCVVRYNITSYTLDYDEESIEYELAVPCKLSIHCLLLIAHII